MLECHERAKNLNHARNKIHSLALFFKNTNKTLDRSLPTFVPIMKKASLF